MSVFVLLFVVPATSVVWTGFVAARMVPVVLEAIWVARDGDIGPWSRWPVRVAIFAILATVQLAVAGMVYALSQLLFPGYPGGWP